MGELYEPGNKCMDTFPHTQYDTPSGNRGPETPLFLSTDMVRTSKIRIGMRWDHCFCDVALYTTANVSF